MESVLRGITIYLVMMVVVRVSGRRTLSEMAPFDFVLILIIAETTQQALLGDDFSITNAAILILTLFTLDIGLSYVKEYWPAADKAIDGRPTLLVADGKIDQRALEWARVDTSDILVAARSRGLERMDQIRHVVLETDGKLSIIPAREE